MKRQHITVAVIAVILCPLVSLEAQSPYKTSWEKDGWILGVGGATSTAGFLFYRSISPLTASEANQHSRESVNWFDRSATYNFSSEADKTSDILFGVAAIAPCVLFTDKTIRNDLGTIALMYLEAWSFIGGTSMLSKGLIEKYRPFVYNPDVPIQKKMTSDAKMSFFSNHTAAAFTSAVFISTVYSDYNPGSEWTPYIWAGSLLTASVVGYLRYEAGMHFPTDILVGAAVGSAIGYVIPWIHRAGNDNVSFSPGMHRPEYGFSVQIQF